LRIRTRQKRRVLKIFKPPKKIFDRTFRNFQAFISQKQSSALRNRHSENSRQHFAQIFANLVSFCQGRKWEEGGGGGGKCDYLFIFLHGRKHFLLPLSEAD